jgi:hypothetical protein
MHQRQFPIRGCWCWRQSDLGQLLPKLIPEQLVFVHGKPVSCRQGQDKLVGVVGFHGCIVARNGSDRSF